MEEQVFCPYKGLQPFSPEDAPYFRGRENDQALIQAAVLTSRITVLYGESGVGKTSVVQAGVVTALKHTKRARPVVCRTWAGVDAIAQIKSQVTAELGLEDQDPDGSSSLRDFLVNAARSARSAIVIILDQFDEYMMYDAARTSDAQLAHAVNEANHCSFLLCLREDALGQLDRFSGRIPNLMGNAILLEHLNGEAASRAIREPLEVYKERVRDPEGPTSIDHDLVPEILLATQTGHVSFGGGGRGTAETGIAKTALDLSRIRIELPFLQLVMLRLWLEERKLKSAVIRRATFNELGGVEAIVRSFLGGALDRLPESRRAVAAVIFDRLVTRSGTKIAMTLGDFHAVAGLQDQPAEVEETVQALTRSRILRVVEGIGHAREPHYEILHDVLAPAVLEWKLRFEQEAKERRVSKELADQLERAEKLQRLTEQLEWQKRQAFARELAASSFFNLNIDPERSLLLALYATRSAILEGEPAPEEAQAALQESLRESRIRKTLALHADRVWSVGYDWTGDRLVTASADGTAVIWSDTGPPIVLRGHQGWVRRARFLEQGTRIATAGNDGTLRLWDCATGEPVETHKISSQSPGAMEFAGSPTVLAAKLSQGLCVFDALTGQEKFVLPSDSRFFAISPDASTFAMPIAGNRIQVSSAGGAILRVLEGHGEDLTALAFSRGGQRLASADKQVSLRVWDLRSGQCTFVISKEHYWVNRMDFSPDGKLLCVGRTDEMAVIWDVVASVRITRLRGHRGGVQSVRFSPDGSFVATASEDRTAKVWRVSGNDDLLLHTHESKIRAIAYDPSGARLATASDDRTAAVWDAQDGQRVLTISGHKDGVSGIAFSPDGRRIATAGWDGLVLLSNAQTGETLAELPHRRHTMAVAFDNAGARLAVVGDDSSKIVIWDLARLARTELGQYNDWVNAVAFSPDGDLIAASSDDQTVGVWRCRTGEFIRRFRSYDHFQGVVFTPDGRRVIAGSHDGTAWLGDLASGETSRLQPGHGKPVHDVAVSDDGALAATAGGDGEIRLWELPSGNLKHVLTGHADEVWHVSFSPGGKFVASASLDRTARTWDCATGQELLVLNRGERYSRVFRPDECARMYGIGLAEMQTLAARHLSRNFTEGERRRYLRDEPAPQDPRQC